MAMALAASPCVVMRFAWMQQMKQLLLLVLAVVVAVVVCAPSVAAADEFFVSEARGVDDASYNCSLAMPCRTLAFAVTLPHAFGCKFYLFPETYTQPGNIGVNYNVQACTLSTYQGAGEGLATFDCSNAGAAPCMALSGEAHVDNMIFTGTLSESAIEFFPPLSIVSLHGIKFWQMRAANPDQPPPIIKHLNAVGTVGLSSLTFEQCSLQAVLLDQYAMADFNTMYMLNNTAPQPGLALIDINVGAQRTHSFNLRASIWSGNIGWKSLIHYAPEAPRGMIYLSDSTYVDNQVTGSLVALEGAATICDRCEFARNSGEYSVHMSRNDKRQLQTIQFSITKAVMSQTPPLRFYNATGSISLVWDGRQHGVTSREPVITLEQPASVHMFESLFTNFVSSGPVDLPIVSITLGGTPQTDLTNFFSRIIMSNFTRNSGRIPLLIKGNGNTQSSLMVNISSTTFSFNNNPQAYGGAIRIVDAPRSTVNMDSVQFVSNNADLGGAVYCSAVDSINAIATTAATATQSTTNTSAADSGPMLSFTGTVVFQNNQAVDDGQDVFVDVSAPCSVQCSGSVAPLCTGFLLEHQQYNHDRESGFAVAGAVIGVFLLVGLGTVACFVAGGAFVKSVERSSAV